eukprot:5392710-Amphidinium_carterae.1
MSPGGTSQVSVWLWASRACYVPSRDRTHHQLELRQAACGLAFQRYFAMCHARRAVMRAGLQPKEP